MFSFIINDDNRRIGLFIFQQWSDHPDGRAERNDANEPVVAGEQLRQQRLHVAGKQADPVLGFIAAGEFLRIIHVRSN